MNVVRCRQDLLRHYGARHFGMLEKQFNSDGRLCTVFLDSNDTAVLISTGTAPTEPDITRMMEYPFALSDFLGQIELDRLAAEQLR